MAKAVLNNDVEIPILVFGGYQVTDPDECGKSVLKHDSTRIFD